jgi:phosphoribosylglycinamide formyltransferase 1
MTKLAILLSGRGSNLEAIARNVLSGALPVQIAVVISNREEAIGLERARALGFEAHVVPSKGRDRDAYDREVVALLRERNVDIVCLAGFMRLLGPYFVRAFPGRILNIHPSLLPAFPGLEAQRQALEYGVKFTGCTVHLVDEGVDTGPILCQAVVPVLDDDTVETLSARILKEEHRIYSEAIRLVAENRVRIEGRRVALKPSC